MGVGEAERVVRFQEVAIEGCGDRSRTCIDEYHGSCVLKLKSSVVSVPYLKNVSMECKENV